MRYFTLAECIHSATAAARRIDNTPDGEQRAHLVETVEQLLDPLREAWAAHCRDKALGTAAIRISSGFRSAQLNAAIGGAATSAHCCGYAFDLVPCNGQLRTFKAFCRAFLAGKAFDQLISEDENADGTPRWIHLGYKSPRGEQRRMFRSMRGGTYRPMT